MQAWRVQRRGQRDTTQDRIKQTGQILSSSCGGKEVGEKRLQGLVGKTGSHASTPGVGSD